MPELLTRKVEERVIKREEVAAPLPPRRRFVRWVEWLGGLFLVISAVVAVIWVANLEDAADEVVFEDDGVSVAALGPVHTDPNYEVPDLWIGQNLDGTLEEIEEARIAALRGAPGGHLPIYQGSTAVSADEPFAPVEYWVGLTLNLGETVTDEAAPEFWVGLTLGVADEVEARRQAVGR